MSLSVFLENKDLVLKLTSHRLWWSPRTIVLPIHDGPLASPHNFLFKCRCNKRLEEVVATFFKCAHTTSCYYWWHLNQGWKLQIWLWEIFVPFTCKWRNKPFSCYNSSRMGNCAQKCEVCAIPHMRLDSMEQQCNNKLDLEEIEDNESTRLVNQNENVCSMSESQSQRLKVRNGHRCSLSIPFVKVMRPCSLQVDPMVVEVHTPKYIPLENANDNLVLCHNVNEAQGLGEIKALRKAASELQIYIVTWNMNGRVSPRRCPNSTPSKQCLFWLSRNNLTTLHFEKNIVLDNESEHLAMLLCGLCGRISNHKMVSLFLDMHKIFKTNGKISTKRFASPKCYGDLWKSGIIFLVGTLCPLAR